MQILWMSIFFACWCRMNWTKLMHSYQQKYEYPNMAASRFKCLQVIPLNRLLLQRTQMNAENEGYNFGISCVDPAINRYTVKIALGKKLMRNSEEVNQFCAVFFFYFDFKVKKGWSLILMKMMWAWTQGCNNVYPIPFGENRSGKET